MADLMRMDDRQFRRAKRLIRQLCANYDSGNCLPLDDGNACLCPQLITRTLICKYFRTAVLPSDRALWAEVMAEKPVKSCCVCGKKQETFHAGHAGIDSFHERRVIGKRTIHC